MAEEKRIKTIIDKVQASTDFKFMKKGVDYYNGEHDVKEKRRMGMGQDGKPVQIVGLPNSIIIDNQYARMVDQKINYLFSDTPVANTDNKNDALSNFLNDFMDKRFLKNLQNAEKDALNCKIGWLYVYVEGEEFKCKRVPATSVIPIWEDEAHESLKEVIRQFTNEEWDNTKEEFVKNTYVEHFTVDDVTLYKKDENGELKKEETNPYLKQGNKSYNWGKIPFIYFKYNEEETSLLKRIKTLQDAINIISSNFMDNMLEDARSTILVVKGMEAQDAAEFRANVSQYSYIGIPAEDGTNADVKPLYIEVNSENYKVILSALKEKLIENARGVDAKNDKASQAPNELNIKSMYSDIELDANGMELQSQASFEYLQYFIKRHLNINTDDVIEVSFKRNSMVNETGLIDNLTKLVGVISEKTIIEEVPYVKDPEKELEQIKKEKTEIEREVDVYEVGDDDALLGGKSVTA